MWQVNTDRRQATGYKLRVYFEQIKTVEAMTQEQWVEAYTKAPGDVKYMPKLMWLAYLKECALVEAMALTAEVQYEAA